MGKTSYQETLHFLKKNCGQANPFDDHFFSVTSTRRFIRKRIEARKSKIKSIIRAITECFGQLHGQL